MLFDLPWARVHWTALALFVGFIANALVGVRLTSQAGNHLIAALCWSLPFVLFFTGTWFGSTWARWLRGIVYGIASLLAIFPFAWSLGYGSFTLREGYDPTYTRLSSLEAPSQRLILYRRDTQGALGAPDLEVVQEETVFPGVVREAGIWTRDRAGYGELIMQDDGPYVRVCERACTLRVIDEERLRLR